MGAESYLQEKVADASGLFTEDELKEIETNGYRLAEEILKQNKLHR